MQITHSKVSGIADGADATKVQPSDWNASHVISGGSVPAGYFLSNPVVKRLSGHNLASGDNDIYTVPAGKRVAVISCLSYNASASSITRKIQVKVSGVYYPLEAATAVAAAATGVLAIAYIFEPGEIVSVNTTGAGLNVYFMAVEYDSSSSLYSAKLTSLASGDNTLYTVPVGKTALICNSTNTQFWANGPALGNANYVNTTGATRTYNLQLVASGQASGSSYKVGSGTLATASKVSINLPGSLGAGDFVNLNVDAATSGQFAWVTVLEI